MASEKVERLKIWVGLLVFLVGQAVSIGLSLKAQQTANHEDKAQEAYKTLSDGLVRISEDNVKLHSDLANLRGYLAGLQTANTAQPNDSKPPPIVKGFQQQSKPEEKPVVRPRLKLPEMHASPKVYQPHPLGRK